MNQMGGLERVSGAFGAQKSGRHTTGGLVARFSLIGYWRATNETVARATLVVDQRDRRVELSRAVARRKPVRARERRERSGRLGRFFLRTHWRAGREDRSE